MTKVFLFGIDGAPPEVIFGEWLDELPNMKRLMDRGCWTRINSTTPPVSVTAWTTMTTGLDPADHGIFECYFKKPGTYEYSSIVTSRNVRDKTIWEIASDNGMKSVVAFVPLTWPMKQFDGNLVSGFMTPLSETTEFAHPSTLKAELNENLKEPLFIDIKSYRSLTKEDQLAQITRMTELHLDTLKYLVKNKPWDLFFGVIHGSDRINHGFWRYCDKTHRDYDPNSKFIPAMKSYYGMIDKAMGEIIDGLDEDTIVIVLSDHGIMKMDNRVNLSDWLIKEGYLVLKNPVEGIGKLERDNIDWVKTKVYATGAYDGQIFFNVKGREPNGIIDPEEYDAFLEEFEAKLKAIPGDDGRPLDTKTFRKKDYFRGKREDIAPDLVVYFDDMNYGCNTSRIGNETLWSPQTAAGSDDATHSKQGIFVMANGDKKGEIGEVEIRDIPVTILKHLGLQIPEYMKGKVVC